MPREVVYCGHPASLASARSELCEYSGIDPDRVFVTHLAASALATIPMKSGGAPENDVNDTSAALARFNGIQETPGRGDWTSPADRGVRCYRPPGD
jgi:hypothetical protein